MFLAKKIKGSMMSHGYTAFTLAEVLITLGIIGVVAVMTIPTIMNKMEKSKEYNQMKKAYSILSNVHSMILQDNGSSFAGLATTSLELANLFKKYMKTIKDCQDSSDSPNCYIANSETTKELSGADYAGTGNIQNDPKVISLDGFTYIFELGTTNCDLNLYQKDGENQFCGVIYVDINGKTLPNTLGKDIFSFSVNKYNLTPYKDYRFSDENQHCKLPGDDTWNGCGCAARAIRESGINYY